MATKKKQNRKKTLIWSCYLVLFDKCVKWIFHHLLFSSLFSTCISFFFSLAIVLPPSVSLSLHSSSEPTPRQAVRPRGGSNQLNYWEHKNAAANGSWINTLAKLLLRLPLAATGHQAENTEAEDAVSRGYGWGFIWGWGTVMTRLGHPQYFGLQGANLIMILVIYWQQMQQWYENWLLFF